MLDHYAQTDMGELISGDDAGAIFSHAHGVLQ
jgi:hypothetical protein